MLGLSMLLVLMLAISGASFMQLDLLERRMGGGEVDNHSAFYLASAGIERARETFKIPDDFTWTSLLEDPAVTDPAPDPRLCPDPTRGCVIPPFGPTVTAPDLPFDGGFSDGQYQVRAFNNEPGTVDTDRKITFRALGRVDGQEKVLELSGVEGTTGIRLINCQDADPDAPCPDVEHHEDYLDYIPGREPASTPALPTWDPDFYRDEANLPCSTEIHVDGDITLVPGPTSKPGQLQIQSGGCYYVTGDATVHKIGAGWQGIVIFSDGALTVNGDSDFSMTDSILISMGELQLKAHAYLQAPEGLPALIAGGNVKGDQGVTVYGNIFAEGSVGTADNPWNSGDVHGVIMGGDVYLKYKTPLVTDDGNPAYYDFMPGFTYPNELKSTTVTGPNSWREIE